MIKKFFLTAGILAVIILAVGITSCNIEKRQSNSLGDTPMPNPAQTQPDNSAASQPKPAAQIEQSAEQIAAINREAIDNRNSTACSSLQKEQDKINCEDNVIITKASDSHDSSMCDLISNAQWKSSWKDSVILVTARDSKNPALCDQMTEKSRVAECKL